MEALLRWLKRLGVTGGLILLALYVAFWAYSLPRHIKVHVTGTETLRGEVEKPSGRLLDQDVRYVMAEGLDGEPHMFRNVDTGWGWPPYFKFDSGDVAAQANNLALDNRDEIVLIRYYGFRIRMLSMFPNILSMREVTADYQPIPWLTIFFVFAHLVAIGFLAVLLRDPQERREEGSQAG
jgi:hypothetical protein